MSSIRVTVWNEFRHEKNIEEVKKIYPDGMHKVIADALNAEGSFKTRLACLDDPDHGLTDDVLADTDVLIWWGHMHHGDVRDDIVQKVVRRVWDGMGFVGLHSAHVSKPLTRLLGTECMLRWRVEGEKEILWVCDPSHPIARGLGDRIEVPAAEMYGEWFQIPTPDELVFISWFEGGEVFRSGCVWKRGQGKIFYFRPGHETFPIFHQKEIQQVIANGVKYVAPTVD